MRAALLALLLLSCTKPAPQQAQAPAAPQITNETEPDAMNAPIPVAAREEPTTDLSGIWEGQLGARAVRACFTERSFGTFGAYYDLSRLRLIGLNGVDGDTDAYGEAGPRGGPVWRDVQAKAAVLTARWTSGGRTLPVRLRRVAGADAGGEDGPCASVAFHRPRLAGVRIVRTRARVDGVAYTKLTLDTRGHFDIAVEEFALDGTSPAVRRINAAFGEGLRGEGSDGWLDCSINVLRDRGGDGESSESAVPVMISRRWLSVLGRGSTFCGGAHPSWYASYQLFDLSTGAEVNAIDWFNAEAVHSETAEGSREVSKAPSPAFQAFLLAHWRPNADAGDADCRAFIRDNAEWNIGLTRRGFVFTPQLPHVMQACEEASTVPFDQLRRWLNPVGAAAVAALRAERR